jgi:hypothetical protein
MTSRCSSPGKRLAENCYGRTLEHGECALVGLERFRGAGRKQAAGFHGRRLTCDTKTRRYRDRRTSRDNIPEGRQTWITILGL